MLIFTIALLGTLIPTTLYILLVWWLDRYEKEPIWLLILAFLWGAVPAAILSVIFEVILELPVSALGGESLLTELVGASLIAPLVEETFKGVALLGLLFVFRREFDGVLDGIIYGAMIGFGFAFSEDLFAYFLPILSEEGLGAGVVNILMRSIAFGFNHAFWTAIIGATLGYARLSRDRSKSLLVPIAGWMLAVTLHGIHNAGATLVEQTFCLSLLMSFLVAWGGVFILLVVSYLMLRRQSRWIARGLIEEVRRGALTYPEFQLLRSASKRSRLRWRAWKQGGRQAYRAVGRYYQCATELAFKKHHLRTLGDEGGNLAEIQRLRQQLAELRAQAWPWLGLRSLANVV